MALADPLLVCREILLADQAVTDLVGSRVYATPDLPPDRDYPCVRLTHTGASEYAPVSFRHAHTAGVQVDIWSPSMSGVSEAAEAVMGALNDGPPQVDGALHIRPITESRELDEQVQPPLYRYRADLSVRVTSKVGN